MKLKLNSSSCLFLKIWNWMPSGYRKNRYPRKGLAKGVWFTVGKFYSFLWREAELNLHNIHCLVPGIETQWWSQSHLNCAAKGEGSHHPKNWWVLAEKTWHHLWLYVVGVGTPLTVRKSICYYTPYSQGAQIFRTIWVPLQGPSQGFLKTWATPKEPSQEISKIWATQVFQKFCAFFGAFSCGFLKGNFDAPCKMLCKKAQGTPQKKKHKKPKKNLHSGRPGNFWGSKWADFFCVFFVLVLVVTVNETPAHTSYMYIYIYVKFS